ncbi:MAG: histidine kinase [Bacteroidota bacterium]
MDLGDFVKKYRERLLPLLICLVIPWLQIINSAPYRESLGVGELIGRWLLIATFLLIIWYANDYVISSFKNKFLLIPANILVVGVILGIQALLIQFGPEIADKEPVGLIIFRMSIASTLFITIQGSMHAIRQNAQLKMENYALQSENYRAQLDQLKKQVNPHFLFNSLSTLQTMIHSGHEQSEEFVYQLSDVYRQLLQTRETNVISLQKELEFLNAYLFLLRNRHEHALEIDIKVEEGSLAYSLPTFGLQLLVENCTKHNIVSERNPLKIEIFQRDPMTITVSNNLQPKRNVQSFGVGLENLKKRYELMGIEDGVVVEQDDTHYSVTLKLF